MAQALDNSSPDHVEVDGKSLGESDWAERESAIACISRVSTTRQFSFAANGVRLIATKSRFIVDCPCVQRDSVGRNAAVVCSGEYDLASLTELGNSVSIELSNFAQRIGRSVAADKRDDILDCFGNLEKKIRSTEVSRKVLVGAFAVVAAFVLARCLAPKHSTRESEQASPSLSHPFE